MDRENDHWPRNFNHKIISGNSAGSDSACGTPEEISWNPVQSVVVLEDILQYILDAIPAEMAIVVFFHCRPNANFKQAMLKTQSAEQVVSEATGLDRQAQQEGMECWGIKEDVCTPLLSDVLAWHRKSQLRLGGLPACCFQILDQESKPREMEGDTKSKGKN